MKLGRLAMPLAVLALLASAACDEGLIDLPDEAFEAERMELTTDAAPEHTVRVRAEANDG